MMRSVRNLIQNYNTFLIDLCGVIHDGINHYPEALEVLLELKRLEKDVLLISNSPRPSSTVMKKLIDMSPHLSNFNLVTSGDFFLYLLKSDLPEFNFLKSKAFVWDDSEEERVTEIFPSLLLTKHLNEADYVVMLSYTKDINDIEKLDPIIDAAITLGLPCVCINPDVIAISGEQIVYTAGSYAKRYEELGGVVHYLGKPNLNFYRFALSNHNISLAKAISIGDNLHTDIMGAYNLKIDSLLIRNGIHKDVEDLDNMLSILNIRPTHSISNLCL